MRRCGARRSATLMVITCALVVTSFVLVAGPAAVAFDTYFIDVTVTPAGAGTVVDDQGLGHMCSAQCTFGYPDTGGPPPIVTLTTTPNPGWDFSPGWGGSCPVTTGSCSVTPGSSAHHTPVTAGFTQSATTTTTQPSATTTTNANGGGGTTTQPSTTVTTNANGGGGTTTTVHLVTTVSGPGTVTSNPPGVTCAGSSPPPAPSVTTMCTAVFPRGTHVMLTEIPSNPPPDQVATAGTASFTGWGADCAPSGVASTCTLVMNADRATTAGFAAVAPGTAPPRPVGVSVLPGSLSANRRVLLGASTGAGASIATIAWSFGGANGPFNASCPPDDPIVAHAFAMPGNHTVGLKVTDTSGQSVITSTTVHVTGTGSAGGTRSSSSAIPSFDCGKSTPTGPCIDLVTFDLTTAAALHGCFKEETVHVVAGTNAVAFLGGAGGSEGSGGSSAVHGAIGLGGAVGQGGSSSSASIHTGLSGGSAIAVSSSLAKAAATHSDKMWTTTGAVRINGLDVTPKNGGDIVLDDLDNYVYGARVDVSIGGNPVINNNLGGSPSPSNGSGSNGGGGQTPNNGSSSNGGGGQTPNNGGGGQTPNNGGSNGTNNQNQNQGLRHPAGPMSGTTPSARVVSFLASGDTGSSSGGIGGGNNNGGGQTPNNGGGSSGSNGGGGNNGGGQTPNNGGGSSGSNGGGGNNGGGQTPNNGGGSSGSNGGGGNNGGGQTPNNGGGSSGSNGGGGNNGCGGQQINAGGGSNPTASASTVMYLARDIYLSRILPFANSTSQSLLLGTFPDVGRFQPRLFGLALGGNATVQFVGGQAKVNTNLSLPSVFDDGQGDGVTAPVTLSGATPQGLLPSAHGFCVSSALIGSLALDSLQGGYSGNGTQWDISAALTLGDAVSIPSAFGLTDGNLASGSGSVDAANPGLGLVSPWIYLNHIDFSMDAGPPVVLSGNVTLSAGGEFNTPFGNEAAASLAGGFVYTDSDPWEFSAHGIVSLLGMNLTNGSVSYWSNGGFGFSGHFDWDLFNLNVLHVTADISADVYGPHSFNVDVAAQLCLLFDSLCSGGEALVSSRGMAGCLAITGPFGFHLHIGAGYSWGGSSIDVMWSSCDVGPWRIPPPSTTSAARGDSGTVQLIPSAHSSTAAVTTAASSSNCASPALAADDGAVPGRRHGRLRGGPDRQGDCARRRRRHLGARPHGAARRIHGHLVEQVGHDVHHRGAPPGRSLHHLARCRVTGDYPAALGRRPPPTERVGNHLG